MTGWNAQQDDDVLDKIAVVVKSNKGLRGVIMMM
jgi:hypothetical protein